MRLTTLAVTSACILLSGCSSLSERIGSKVDESQAKAARLVKEVGGTDTTTRSASPVVHDNGMWIGKNVVKLEQQDQLPPIFREPATFDRTIYSLAEFAERITLRSGIPTKVASDVILVTGGRPQQANAAGAGQSGAAATAPGALMNTAPAGANAIQSGIRIVYPNGNLKGLLDTATARFGVFWKYVNGTIQIFYTDTRTFQISAIPGDSALTATVASGSVSGNGGGAAGATSGGVSSTNNQNTAVKSTLSVYPNIEKSVSVMLSSFGQVVSSPSTGTITVTDTPDRLDRIAQFIENENKSLKRQVMINVTVLAVTVSNADNLGINWNLVYNDLSKRFGVQNTMPSEPNSTSFAAGILTTASSKWAGTSVIIDALSSQGQVRRETTASVVTLNNQPVPVQVAKQTSYLMSSQTTLASGVGSTTTLTPGMVTSGFNMTILPHVLNNGTVMLQFSTDISSLRGIRSVESNGSRIESPEVDTRNFLQRVAMKSNETLIISGFEQTDDNLDRRGVGHPGNFLLGGGYKAGSNKEVIVILITPVTVEST